MTLVLLAMSDIDFWKLMTGVFMSTTVFFMCATLWQRGIARAWKRAHDAAMGGLNIWIRAYERLKEIHENSLETISRLEDKPPRNVE